MSNGLVLLLLLAVSLYFLPFFVAALRGRQAGAIFALNLFLGWTLLGWVAALVWALTSAEKTRADAAPSAGSVPPPPAAWTEPPTALPLSGPSAAAPLPGSASNPSDPADQQGEAIATRLRAKARSRGLAEQPGEDDGPASQTAAGLAPVGAFLEYADAGGQASARTITLRRLEDGANGLRILAWCHMRRAPRRFLANRIVALTDVTTGEVHDGPEAATAWLQRLAETSEGAGRTLIDAATLLAFIAAADDDLAAAERDAAQTLLSALPDAGGVSVTARASLVALLPSLSPDGQAALQAAVRLKAQPEAVRRQLVAGIEAVIVADAVSHPREQAALTHISRVMGL